MSEDRVSFQVFEEKLEEILIGVCRSKSLIGDQLMLVEELEEAWHKIAPEYMADAVPQVVEYPSVAIAWAGYLGMGVAALWDADWAKYGQDEQLYASVFRDPRGFDCMDELVVEQMLSLGLESDEAKELEDVLRNCSYAAQTLIRREGIEPQSTEAFYLFARTVKVMFKIGISIELKKLGYKYEKMVVPMPDVVS